MRRVDRRHPLVVETDRVRDLGVAEHHRHRLAFALDLEGPVELVGSVDAALVVAVEVRVEGACQHLLVADHPIDARLGRQADHALPHSHLRRPHAGGPALQQALEQALSHLDLALGVFAMREVVLRELDLGIGGPRRLDVDQERQDRVVVRREGQLGLAAVGQLPILRDDLLHDLHLRLEERLLVRLREIAILPLQLRQPGIGFGPCRVAPREVEPDLQVEHVLVGELRVGGT